MTTHFYAATRGAARNIDEPFDFPFEADFRAVLWLARGIDRDEERVRDWYMTVRIREFGGKTAQELVQMGETDLVIGFLWSIRGGHRG